MKIVSLIPHGFLIGLANIIPGVSGGTMAMILGIYERLIRSLNNFGFTTIRQFLSFRFSVWRDELRRIDAGFLIGLAIGATIAILATSKLIVYLLKNQHDPTYGFFCGLILVSIIVPLKMISRFRWQEFISILIAIILTIGITIRVGGEKNLEKEKIKAENEISQIASEKSFGRLSYLFLTGAISISAMILPGISGSFVMLLLGVYFDILTAISDRDFLTLGVFAIGCGVGILAFTRLLNFLLEKFHDTTIAFLIGLMIGSLYGLWPFRTFEIVNGERIDVHYILPQLDLNFAITILAFLIGGVTIWIFSRFEAFDRKEN